MLEILLAGGWAMAPILLCSAVAVAIILERFWSLRRSTVIPANLGAEVREWARTRKLDPDHIEVLRKNSPLGELLAAALTVRNRPPAPRRSVLSMPCGVSSAPAYPAASPTHSGPPA